MVTRVPELPTADFAFGVETDPGIGAFCTLGLTPGSIALDFIGLRGCVMLTGGEITTLAHVTDPSGVALQPLPLQPDPVFNGFRIFVQWTLVFPPLDLRLIERTEETNRTTTLRLRTGVCRGVRASLP